MKAFFKQTKGGLKVGEGLWLRLRKQSARAARQSGGLLREKCREILRSWVQIPPGPPQIMSQNLATIGLADLRTIEPKKTAKRSNVLM